MPSLKTTSQLNTLQTVVSRPTRPPKPNGRRRTSRSGFRVHYVVSSGVGTPDKKQIYGQASRLISIGKLNASPRLHTRPIDLVIFQEPLEALRPGRSHLVEGFTLRCLQRFSLPDVATRRYRWRDNRYTRGPSIPVLSY